MEELQKEICDMISAIENESVLRFLCEIVSDAFIDCQVVNEQAS